MASELQFRRYDSSTLANLIGKEGELILNSDTWELTTHDGTTPGGNPVLTKVGLGLNNVDNTADVDKPISNATQAALNNKLGVNAQAADVNPSGPTIAGALEGKSDLPDAVVVEGAGTEEANGVYIADVSPEGDRYYVQVGSTYIEGWGNNAIYWDSFISSYNIYTELTPGESSLTYRGSSLISDEQTPDLTEMWAEVSLGMAPPPTVRRATPDEVYVAINDYRLTNEREWTADTVSQVEAEAGTATTRRAWTAQRVRQAIAAWWIATKASIIGTDVQAQSATLQSLADAADDAARRAAVGGAIGDAPSDGSSYVRKDESWEVLTNLLVPITAPDNTVWAISITNDGTLDTHATTLSIPAPNFYNLTAPDETVWTVAITNDGNLTTTEII